MIQKVVNSVRRSAKFIGIATGVAFIASTIVVLLAEDVYRSTAVVAPASKFSGSAISPDLGSLGFAADQLGMNLGGSASDPSALLPVLLESRVLFEDLLSSKYPTADGDSITIMELLEIPADQAPNRRIELAMEEGRGKLIGHRYLRQSGVTTLWVDSPDPLFSASLAKRLIAELDDLNSSLRTAAARDRLQFIRARWSETGDDLEKAERELRDFRLDNRSIAASPKLRLEEGRLMRNVRVLEEVFLTLRTQLELARIEAEKSTSVLITVDPAVVPAEPHSPKRVLVVLLWTLGVGLLATTTVLLRHATQFR